MKTVWRIEDANGNGVAEQFCHYFAGMNTLPEDFSESTLAKYPAPVCAFPDRETLKNWMPRNSWNELFAAGYRFQAYRISNYALGRSMQQVIFAR